VNFMRDLFPRMERLVTDTFRACFGKIDPNRNQNGFEIFGYDFMLDENFKTYLIEVNTNPSLEICCPLLARIIPELLENSFRIAMDPIYQPPILVNQEDGGGSRARRRVEIMQPIKYSLIFDERIDKQNDEVVCISDQTLLEEIAEEELFQ
jgi:hypothetical protein